MAFGDRKLTAFHTKAKKPMKRSSIKAKPAPRSPKLAPKPVKKKKKDKPYNAGKKAGK